MPIAQPGDEDWAHHHVILFLAERLGRDPSTISPSDRLRDLAIDSLDIVEFIMALEDEFEGNLPDEDIERIETVQDMIDEVRKWRN